MFIFYLNIVTFNIFIEISGNKWYCEQRNKGQRKRGHIA